MVKVDIATCPSGTCSISCNGSDGNKSKCPEWGPTIAAENYYKAKLDVGR